MEMAKLRDLLMKACGHEISPTLCSTEASTGRGEQETNRREPCAQGCIAYPYRKGIETLSDSRTAVLFRAPTSFHETPMEALT